MILGGDFYVNLFGMTDYFHVGESIPRPRTLVDTNDSLRARALHTMVTELDLTVRNTWMNADTEQELFTRSSWSNPEDSLTQMDFIKTENEVHDEECCKLAWLGARRILARCGYSNIDRLEELEQDGTFACGNREGSQEGGIQGDDRDRNGAQNTSVEEEENRSVPRTIRTELALTRNLEKEKSTEKGETPGQDQGECRDGESSQENAEQALQLEINCEGRKSQVCSHKILPRPLLNLRRTGGVVNPIRETTLGRAVEKHENRLCWWNVDLAKETGKCLNETEKRERLTGSNHSRCIERFAPRMFGKAGEVVVADVLEHGFSGRMAVFVDGDGSESGGCNVLDQVQAYCWTVCDAKSLGLRLAQVTPSTEIRKCANCVCAEDTRRCWSVSAVEGAELSRVWQKEIVVVQFDVKKAFDHVDHRAAFRAMKLQGVSLFSMALIAAIWNGSCMKACLGTVTSNKVQMSRGLPQGAPESPVIFTMIMELVLRDLIKSWISRKLAWRLDDFTLAAICYADDVVLIAVSVSAAETMVSEVIEKLKDVGLTVGAQKTHWTSFPKMVDKNIMVDGSAVLWEEVLEFVGSMVCLDGNARHAIAHRTAQANKCRAKWKFVLNSPWLPRLLRLNIVKTTMWQAFFWSSSVWTTVKAQRDKIASWSARMVANVVGVKKPPEMELGQWWRLWHRTGHRWIEKCNMNVLMAIRDRMLSWAGHVARMDYKEICAKAPRCRGLQWWRWRQINWKEVERDKWSGPHPQRFKIYRWEDMVAGEVSKFAGNADGLSETVHDNTGWLRLAQNRGRWKQFSKCGKSPV